MGAFKMGFREMLSRFYISKRDAAHFAASFRFFGDSWRCHWLISPFAIYGTL